MISNTFCPLPFIHINPSVTGYYRVCCNSDYIIDYDDKLKTSPTTVNTKSFNEVFENNLNDYRIQMMNGERPEPCNVCYHKEDNGMSSMRQNYLAKKELMDLVDITNPKIRYLDIKFDNKCNLECRMCDPSSTLKHWKNFLYFKENNIELPLMWQHLDEGYEKKIDRDYYQNKKKQYVVELLQSIRVLKVTGGEPFLSKDFYNILQTAIDLDYAKNITLKITTNGTKFVKKFMKLFEHFNKVFINLSIDGIEEIYNYIRYPSNWNLINKQINILVNHTDNVIINVSCLVSIYNWLNLRDISNYFKKYNINVTFDTNVRPSKSELHVRHLPNYILDEGVDRFDRMHKQYKDIKNVANLYKSKQQVLVQKKIKETTIAFDKIRNQQYKFYLDRMLSLWIDKL